MRARAVLRYIAWAEVLCEVEPSEATAAVLVMSAIVEQVAGVARAVGLRVR